MHNLPAYIGILLMFSTAFAVFMLLKAARNSKALVMIISVWMITQGILAYTGFYTETSGLPPRFVLAIWPPVIAIIIMFFTKQGKSFMDGLDPNTLTLLHLVRIPVELVLFWLAVNKVVSPLVTFEGTNPDIFSGVTAPLMWYLTRHNKNRKLLLGWNILCLALLINVVVTAFLGVPTRLQQLSFDQPNTAILYFPYIWLPACIVPIVLLSHLVAIRRLLLFKSAPILLNGLATS